MTFLRQRFRSPELGWAFFGMLFSTWLLCAYYWTIALPGSYFVFSPGREASRLTLILLLGLFISAYWQLLHVRHAAFQRLRLSRIFFGLVLLALPFFFLPPIGSQDIYHSLFFGSATHLGLNPYRITLDTYPMGAFAGAVHGYFNQSAPWGPLWIDLMRASTALFGTNAAWNIFFLRLVLFALLAGSILVLRQCMAVPSRTKRILALTAWNPLLFYFSVGELHNDILLVFFLLCATLFYYRQQYALSAVSIGLAAGVKWFPLLFLPLLMLAVLRRRPMLRSMRMALVCGVLGMGTLLVLLFPYWEGGVTLQGVLLQSVAYSKPLFVEQLSFFLSSGGHGWVSSATAFTLSVWISRILFFLLYLWTLWKVLRGRLAFSKAALWVTIFLLLFGLFWLVQWYALWLFPFALMTVRGAETLFRFSCFVIASLFMTYSASIALLFLFLLIWFFLSRPVMLHRRDFGTGT